MQMPMVLLHSSGLSLWPHVAHLRLHKGYAFLDLGAYTLLFSSIELIVGADHKQVLPLHLSRRTVWLLGFGLRKSGGCSWIPERMEVSHLPSRLGLSIIS